MFHKFHFYNLIRFLELYTPFREHLMPIHCAKNQIFGLQYIPLTNRVRGPYRKLRTEFFPPRFMAQIERGKNEDP